ncbi:Hvo_1808 family surface protein [Halobacterium zhouii]|uniref:Hvo_1808 family surface protein n=1 Tax=Halobacterium zhouii TaxID=2902624 RepID=UPI001E65B72C|nr:Hvo_1808 family surface protein [Halobacterium zhouii]
MARRIAAVALVALVLLAGCQSPVGTGPATSPDETTNAPTPDGQNGTEFDYADPESDVLGWEGGLWYNESIDVTVEDGLNATERNATIDRAMARVEQIRRLEFEKPVPVEVISRETYRSEYAGGGNASDALQTFDDTKFEALFLVGENNSSLAVQESNRGSNVLGFYTPRDDRIVIISESSTPTIEETTLAHELMHALQFRNFEANFSSPTRDAANAHSGLTEGEASFLDSKYSQRCGTNWSCVAPATAAGGGGGGSLHLGVYMMKYFPYADGSEFVEHFYEQGGWDRVASLYENPPTTSEQVAQPEKYGEDQPTNVTLPDRSDANWDRVTVEGRAPYGEVGVGGLTAMLAYPYYHQGRPGNVLGPRAFLNIDQNGNLDRTDPFNYTTTPVDGWDGEKMYIYESDSGEAAYTWRLAWDSERDAREFASAYRNLLQYWGGERVDAETARWRIPEGESQFADAFRVTVEGDTVTIVNAPTVEQLDDVHAESA